MLIIFHSDFRFDEEFVNTILFARGAHITKQSLTEISFGRTDFPKSVTNWSMFGGQSGTTPDLAFHVLTFEVPTLLVFNSENAHKASCTIMEEFATGVTGITARQSSLTQINRGFGSALIVMFAQGLHYNYKKFHGRPPKNLKFSDTDRKWVQYNVNVIYDYVLSSPLRSLIVDAYPTSSPTVLSTYNPFYTMLYKANRGIALTWEAYVSYKNSAADKGKGSNQQQLMFPNHFFLLQNFTSHVKVSKPGDLLNYDELDEAFKYDVDFGKKQRVPPFICYGGVWQDFFEFKNGHLLWLGTTETTEQEEKELSLTKVVNKRSEEQRTEEEEEEQRTEEEDGVEVSQRNEDDDGDKVIGHVDEDGEGVV